MRIELKGYEQTDTRHIVDLFIEREQGKYNNLPQTVEFLNSEVEGLTKDQVVTKAWLQVKPTALLVFNRVWECRNSPQQPVIEDIPEYDENGNIVWGERVDKTPINEDCLESAVSPLAEVENPIGFEIVELPTIETPVETPQPNLLQEIENLKMLVAELGLMVGGGL